MPAKLLGLAVTAILAVLLVPGASLAARGENGTWETYRSERFGYSLLFPVDLLQLQSESADGQSLEFDSPNRQTKLKVLTVINTDNVSPRQYRAEVIGKMADYRALTYGPMGRNWFVLSGVRGPSIYYQKVVFSCGGRVINAFALTYPSSEKLEYDSIVTKIEKNFRASSGAACAATAP